MMAVQAHIPAEEVLLDGWLAADEEGMPAGEAV